MNLQIILMSFYYINVETIRKAKIVHETLNMEKKYTSPADEFLMHTVEPNNRKIRQKVKNK